MAELGAEGIVYEVKNYLATNLASKLTIVDGRYSEQLVPKNVTEWRVDDPIAGKLPNKLPAGWVVATRTQVDQWGSSYDYEGTEVVVWVLLRDQNAETLRRKIYRTMQAVWETLKAGHFDSTIAWQILEAPEMDFSEIMTGPQGILLSDARLRVKMYTREAP